MKKGKIRQRLRVLGKALHMELREHKSSFLVYWILRAAVIVTMILQIHNRNYENVILCILTLILLVAPSLVQLTFKVELPSPLEISILVFIFAAEILGEINRFYEVFPQWDIVLHTINGFLAAAIGFSLVDLLNRSPRKTFHLSPAFMALVSFSFSMTIGVLWEFFEFGMDKFFGLDMQKDTVVHTIHSMMLNVSDNVDPSTIKGIQEVVVNGKELGVGGYLDIGLIDTIMDLGVNFIGAVVFSICGFLYVRNRGKGIVVSKFIPHGKEKTRDFLAIAAEEEKKEEEKEEK